MNDLIKVFKINKAHAIKGEVKATLLLNILEIKKLINKRVFIQEKMVYKPVTVSNITKTNHGYIIKFLEFNNINEILVYRDSYILFQETDLAPDDFIKQKDFTDFKVMLDETLIGNVASQFETKAHLILEITLNESGEVMLIPYVDEYIKDVILETTTIVLKRVL